MLPSLRAHSTLKRTLFSNFRYFSQSTHLLNSSQPTASSNIPVQQQQSQQDPLKNTSSNAPNPQSISEYPKVIKTFYKHKSMNVEDAFKNAFHATAKRKGDDKPINIFIHTGCSAPQILMAQLGQLAKQHNKLVHVYHLHVNGDPKYMSKEFEENVHVHPMFFGPNERKAAAQQRRNIYYTPVFLSEAPLLFSSGVVPVDIALLSVSTPDRHGFCSMGINVDCSLAALRNAHYVIAQMNQFVPRTHGDGFVHLNTLDCIVEHDMPLPTLVAEAPLSDVEKRIGANVAELIPDRACVQLGIGNIPNAVCNNLHSHKDLGVHTEMFSDGIYQLYKKGVITNRYKKIHRDEILTSFIMGSPDLYDFVNDNPFVIFRCASFVNDVSRISQNDHMMAINSALEIDFTGQVSSDSLGVKQFSGVGGQVDYISGSAKSNGGKPIIALPSTLEKRDANGKLVSKIQPILKSGAGVVTTRAHVHWVVTEYGYVDLYGLDMLQRAKKLISICHPELRDELTFEMKKRFDLL